MPTLRAALFVWCSTFRATYFARCSSLPAAHFEASHLHENSHFCASRCPFGQPSAQKWPFSCSSLPRLSLSILMLSHGKSPALCCRSRAELSQVSGTVAGVWIHRRRSEAELSQVIGRSVAGLQKMPDLRRHFASLADSRRSSAEKRRLATIHARTRDVLRPD